MKSKYNIQTILSIFYHLLNLVVVLVDAKRGGGGGGGRSGGGSSKAGGATHDKSKSNGEVGIIYT